ncbi:MAG: PspA/IM30 family protein [Wenzhouxiangella sp.]
MTESLKQRVGRLVAGGFNSLLDAIESSAPEAVMEQAVREIDGAIADVRKSLGQVEANRHLTSKRLADDSRRHEELAEQAQIAMKEGRDDLAEAAVSRQLDLEAQIPVLEHSLTDLSDEKERLESYINALKAKKREMREAIEDYRKSRQQQANTGSTGSSANHGDSPQDKADRAVGAFDRVFQRQTGLSGSGATNDDDARLSELEDLSRKNRIAERLAKLKADKP